LRASASAADGLERDLALRPIAEEVIKAFTAAIGTLLVLRKGAGPSLLRELQDAGAGLTAAVESFGAAIAGLGSDTVPFCAGKVLDRVVHLKKMSTQNRAAVRRRLLKSLAQLGDAARELRETTSSKETEADDLDDFDDLGDLEDDDEELEPEERAVLEAVMVVVDKFEEVLKEASSNCVPSGAASLVDLEAAADHASSCANAVDSMAASACGGLEVEPVRKEIRVLRTVAASLSCIDAAKAKEVEQMLDRLAAAVDNAAEA